MFKFSEKVSCIYCGKKIKIEKGLKYCNKCGRDISSMWKDDSEVEAKERLPMFCPNPKCHAPYVEGSTDCRQCRNDFRKHPPIYEKDLYEVSTSSDCVYCPQCGKKNDNNDSFCDCGCDFRINPKILMPPSVKRTFYCAVCNKVKVSIPDGICDSCKQKAKVQTYLCPECGINTVKKYGDICRACVEKKPLRGMGEGFHIVK